MMLRDLGLVLDKESADLKVLAYSQINSDVKIAFDCSWDREIESILDVKSHLCSKLPIHLFSSFFFLSPFIFSFGF